MTPVQEIEFLRMVVNSKEMNVSLPQRKLQSIKQMCQDMNQNPETTVLELIKVLDHLASTIWPSHSKVPLPFSPTVTDSGPEEKWFLRKSSAARQRISIQGFNFQLKLFYRQMLHSQVGGKCGKEWNWRDMDSAGEKDAHKRTGTSCIKTSPEKAFLKAQGVKSLHIQMDSIVAFTYFLKMRGTKNLQMLCLSKQIWKHSLLSV